jgi:hypothetical protein
MRKVIASEYVSLDGVIEHWSTEGPSRSELLAVIDQARERLRQGTLSNDC